MKKLIGSKSRFMTRIALLLVILSISGSCTKTMDNMTSPGSTSGTKGNTGGPGINEVWIQGMAFTPSLITVTAGTTITWTNKDAIAHTVTSDTDLFDSGSIANTGNFSFTFTSAGTFKYHCTPHPTMVATIVVY
jgi:plastocyanin